MIIRFSVFLILATLFSCSYNDRQKIIIDHVAKNKPEIYSNSFENKLSIEFSKTEIVNLTDNKNPQTRIYFYDYLIKKHPSYCFEICINHLKDSSSVVTSTSYDTQENISVSELMIANARKNKIFSLQENQALDSIIVTNIKKYKHLEGQFYCYLNKNLKSPKVEFYEIIRDLVIEKKQNNYFSQISLINYFSNYKNKADDKIIKEYLLNSIKKDKTIYFNSTLEFIANNPNTIYFDILTNFYAENIHNKLTRCDECFFELKLFCEAISKFKNDETLSILNGLIASEKYSSSCKYLAKNEQFYKLLTNSDTGFYKQLIKDLELKLNQKILMEVEKYDK